jgi:hypothetical protein
MGISAFIKQKFESVLGLGIFGKFRRNQSISPARTCKFGHSVFAGNNLCTYGHRAA